ncbi:MAG: asparagine synthase-related protein [Thermodesulfovibrionales bacterium]|nr:asparagine synthase-related protein [Thermodesulfovibrionales bacterium]
MINRDVTTSMPNLHGIDIHLQSKSPLDFAHEIHVGETVSIFLGDFIFDRKEFVDEKSYLEALLKGFGPGMLKHIPGFFYIIQVFKKDRHVRVFNSVFGILPVYYHQHGGVTYISSSLRSIRQASPAVFSPSSLYLLEKSLFHYPLFNETWFNEVKLLAANSYLQFKETLKVIQHTSISDHYTQAPGRWQASLDELSDLFISTATIYLPRDRFVATLTGGFDSRSIVGVALGAGRTFSTYSYGGAETDDIRIPRQIAAAFGFAHRTVPIDEAFAQDHYWDHAVGFLRQSEGGGNISRAHYSYASEILGRDADYLVSGNFGSELIRAMKSPGVMVPQPVFDIFACEDPGQLKKLFSQNSALRYLRLVQADETWERLLEEIALFRAELPSGLTTNQKFYVYMFEEVFRKYFGPEILVESPHLRHRAPFIDFNFIAGVMRTDLAGVYSRFRETNPLNRFHGQVLYAHIMRKTCPRLLDIKLDRNYRPRDFLTHLGKARIIAGYVRQRFKRRKMTATPTYASLCLQSNLDRIGKMKWGNGFFDQAFFQGQLAGGWQDDEMNFTNMVSAALYFNEIFAVENHFGSDQAVEDQ